MSVLQQYFGFPFPTLFPKGFLGAVDAGFDGTDILPCLARDVFLAPTFEVVETQYI